MLSSSVALRCGRGFFAGETKVNVSSAVGIAAVDGDDVLSGLECGERGGGDEVGFVLRRGATEFAGGDAIDVNFAVVIVVHPRLEISQVAGRKFDLAAEPDVGSFPFCADGG